MKNTMTMLSLFQNKNARHDAPAERTETNLPKEVKQKGKMMALSSLAKKLGLKGVYMRTLPASSVAAMGAGCGEDIIRDSVMEVSFREGELRLPRFMYYEGLVDYTEVVLPPTHVFLPDGAFAASVSEMLATWLGASRPATVAVSAQHDGAPMGSYTDYRAECSDELADTGRLLLSRPEGGAARMSDSGNMAMGALSFLMDADALDMRNQLGLGPDSVILLFCTEAAVTPQADTQRAAARMQLRPGYSY